MTRTMAIVLLVLGISSASFAKNTKASWANLSALRAGQKIEVVESNSRKISGAFVNFSDSAISLDGASGEQTIQRRDVRSVKLMKRSHRLRNTLLFGAVGAGAGAGAGAASWESRGFWGGKGTGAAVGAALGFVTGVVVGALWPGHETIYKASSH